MCYNCHPHLLASFYKEALCRLCCWRPTTSPLRTRSSPPARRRLPKCRRPPPPRRRDESRSARSPSAGASTGSGSCEPAAACRCILGHLQYVLVQQRLSTHRGKSDSAGVISSVHITDLGAGQWGANRMGSDGVHIGAGRQRAMVRGRRQVVDDSPLSAHL